MITTEQAWKFFSQITWEKYVSTQNLEWWMTGMVFKVSSEVSDEVVFKLYEKEPKKVEHVDDRVYWSNYKNFKAAYNLLKINGIQTFNLLKTWEISHYEYLICSLLDWIEANQDVIQDSIFLETLTKVHKITREYQWWVCNEDSYKIDWKDAFTQSIYSRLADTSNIIEQDVYDWIKKYIDQKINKLQNPNRYVLSHLDWLQGMFTKFWDRWLYQVLLMLKITNSQIRDLYFLELLCEKNYEGISYHNFF